MEKQKTKMKTGKKIVIGILALLGAGAITAGAFFLPKILKGTAEENPEMQTVYYNIDRYLMQDAKTNESLRQVKSDDGFYHIRFATDENRLVELRCSDKKLVEEIDKENFMGLERNDKGLITGMIPLKQFTGGIAYHDLYVLDIRDGMIVTNTTMEGTGLEYQFAEEDTKGAKIIDISGYSGDPGIQVSSIQTDDRFTAIQDKQGKIIEYWLTERYEITEVIESYCQHCKENVKWKAWTSTDKLPKDASKFGHYYLTKDVQLTETMNTSDSVKLCLDLNGHTVQSPMDRAIYVFSRQNTKLALMDNSKEQTGRMVVSGSGSVGGGIVSAGSAGSRVYVYSGTYDASGYTTTSVGSIMYIGNESELEIYGGEFIGGTTKGKISTSSTTGKLTHTGGAGGSFDIMGVFNMYGGVIRDGKAIGIPYVNSDGQETIAGGYGGNFYIGSGATVNIYGGIIKDGYATTSGGGNIAMSGKLEEGKNVTLNMYGGEISGGRCGERKISGGNIAAWTASHVNIEGGVIKDGCSTSEGGNICFGGIELNIKGGEIRDGSVYDLTKEARATGKYSENIYVYNGNIAITGGYVNGQISVYTALNPTTSKATVTLGGSAKVYGNEMWNLNIAEGVTKNKGVEFLPFNDDANVVFSAYGYFTDPGTASMDIAKYVHSQWDSFPIRESGSRLYLGDLHCLCCGSTTEPNHKCEPIMFKPWGSKVALPYTEGNYALAYDIYEEKTAWAGKGDLRICLNGHKVYGKENARIYGTYLETTTSLSFTDCKYNTANPGALLAVGDQMKDSGACFWFKYNTVNIYHGIFDASRVKSTGYGSAICDNGVACTLNFYGGEVIGGTVKAGATVDASGKVKTTGTCSGAVHVGGTFNMYGGTLRDGKIYALRDYVNPVTGAKLGVTGGSGGITYVTSAGIFNMYGGVIKNGFAERMGGNLYIAGIFNMYGGTIEGGSNGEAYFNGGNVYIATGKAKRTTGPQIYEKPVEFNFAGGEIINGKTTCSGGNLASSSVVNMTGGHIGAAEAPEANGNRASVFFYGSTFNMSGGTIDGQVSGAIRPVTVTNPDGTKTTTNYKPEYNFSGKPVINNNNPYHAGFTPAGYRLNVAELLPGAHINISAPGIFSNPTLTRNKEYFQSDDPYDAITLTEQSELQISDTKFNVGCICGGNCESLLPGGAAENAGHVCQNVTWQRYKTISDPVLAMGTSDNHTKYYYYLDTDVTMKAALTVPAYCDFYLDLNGHTLTSAKNARAFMVYQSDVAKLYSNLSICDSSAERTGKVQMNGIGTTINGGAIALTRNSVFSLYGGEIAGGTGGTGGNIASSVSTINIYGGKITGGHANTHGGNIYTDGTTRIYGGEIKGGTTDGEGGGIYLFSNANLYLFGDAKVTGNGSYDAALNNSNIYKGGSNAFLLNNLQSGAEFGITMPEYKGTFATNAKSGDEAYFKADRADVSPTYVDGTKSLRFEYTYTSEHKHCICGENCATATPAHGHICDSEVEWQEWTSGNQPDPYCTDDQYYYLTKNTSVNSWTPKGKGIKLHLCLNGFNLESTGGRAFLFFITGETDLQSEFSICNCNGNGKVVGGRSTSGATILVSAKTKFDLYGGTIEGGEAYYSTTVASSGYGGNIAVNTGAVFNMYNGAILNGTAETTGGNVNLSGTMNIYGGVISGGVSRYSGSGIYASGGSLSVYGDTRIENNKQTDETPSNVRLTEAVSTMSVLEPGEGMHIGIFRSDSDNGFVTPVLTDTTYDYAAHLLSDLPERAELRYNETAKRCKLYAFVPEHKHCICGATCDSVKGYGAAAASHVCDEQTAWTYVTTVDELTDAAASGGNVYLGADITIGTNLLVKSGFNLCLNGHKLTQRSTSRILNYQAADLTVNICDCTAATDESGVYTAGSLVPYSGTYTYGNGSAIFMSQKGAVLNLYGGIIKGGKVSGIAGNIYVTSSDAAKPAAVNMYGGRIEDGVSGSIGGNIALDTNAIFRMYGGTLAGGQAKTTGGNIHSYGTSSIYIYGGTISGGKAETHGGNIHTTGELNITGGSIFNASSGNENITVGGAGAKNITVSGTETDYPLILTESGENFVLLSDATGKKLHINGGYFMNSDPDGKPALHIMACDKADTGITGGYFGTVKADNYAAEDGGFISAATILTEDSVDGKDMKLRSAKKLLDPCKTVQGTDFTYEIVADVHESHCACGGTYVSQDHATHSPVSFTEIKDSPGLRAALSSGGNYYLGSDITVTQEEGYYKGIDIKADTVLCLNGYHITQPLDGRIFQVASNVEFTLCDCRATGTGETYKSGILKKTAKFSLVGAGMTIGANATFNLYGGTFKDLETTASGGFLAMENNNSVFNMYGGRIENPKAVSYGGAIYAGDAEADRAINIYGGTITGGTVTAASSSGGNIQLGGKNGKGASLSLYGGEILNGKAKGNGGNICSWGNGKGISIYDGTIAGGISESSGNGANISTTADIRISGGTLKGGTTNGLGNNIYFAGASAKTFRITKTATTEPLFQNDKMSTNAKAANVVLAGAGKAVIDAGFFEAYTKDAKTSFALYVSATAATSEINGGFFGQTSFMTTVGKIVRGGYYTDTAASDLSGHIASGYALTSASASFSGVTFTKRVREEN